MHTSIRQKYEGVDSWIGGYILKKLGVEIATNGTLVQYPNPRCGYNSGMILGMGQANERSLQSNTVSHWLGANLESALQFISGTSMWFVTSKFNPLNSGSGYSVDPNEVMSRMVTNIHNR